MTEKELSENGEYLLSEEEYQKCVKRGIKAKNKLIKILKVIYEMIDEIDKKQEPSQDDENLACCLTNAKLELEEAKDCYIDYLA